MMRLRLTFAAPLLCLMMVFLPATARTDSPVPTPAASVPAASTRIPYKQDKQGAGTLAYQSMAGLVLAGLAAYGVVFGLKRFGITGGGPLRTTRRLRIVESMRLSRRSTLHVVDYHGEQLLLAESEHVLRVVSRRSASAGVSAQGVADA